MESTREDNVAGASERAEATITITPPANRTNLTPSSFPPTPPPDAGADVVGESVGLAWPGGGPHIETLSGDCEGVSRLVLSGADSEFVDSLRSYVPSCGGVKWSSDIGEDGSAAPGQGEAPGEGEGEVGGCEPETEFPDGGQNQDLEVAPVPPARHSTADSASQTDCATVEAESNTEQDIGSFMKALTSESKVLKERYQQVLDRQSQLENQVQIKIRCLQQQEEEEKNIFQENGKQIQEVKTKLEELKKKSEREKKEYLQKEQEMKSDIEKLYQTGKRLMNEQEEKESQMAALISEQSENKEKIDGELARVRLCHNEMNKKILEETERALKTEVISLESERQLVVMALDQAETEAETQIRNSGSLPNSAQLQEWQVRLSEIHTQRESLKKQFNTQIELVKNGAKLSSLCVIPPPNLPPAPAEVMGDAGLKSMWLGSVPLGAFQAFSKAPGCTATPHFPSPAPFFPSSSGSAAPSLPGAFPRKLPGAPPGLSAHPDTEAQGCPPAPRTVAKLDKLLEKLQAKLPHCSRVILTQHIKQIKMSRGTIADLSVDELMNLVAQRLREADQACGNPRFCLMCQKVVRGNEVHPMNCSHIIHKECIKYWAQSNKNSTCPFCSTLR